MSFFLGRDGNISVIRVGTVLAVLGIVFIVGGLIIFSLELSTYQTPLQIDPPPGAVDWGVNNISATYRTQDYQIPGQTPEEVVAYYQQKLNDFYGNDSTNPNRQCVRTPDVGNFPDYREGGDSVPYFYSCMFERSGFRALQFTRVFIQPGVFNADPQLNTQGMTVVRHEQQWNP